MFIQIKWETSWINLHSNKPKMGRIILFWKEKQTA